MPEKTLDPKAFHAVSKPALLEGARGTLVKRGFS